MKIGFVILNYFTVNEVVIAHSSICNGRKSSDQIHIYIVDNGSPQTIQRALAEKFEKSSDTTLILSNQNCGFAKGNNLGIRAAIADRCDFVACLNNDIAIDDTHALIHCINACYTDDKSIAVIGPEVIAKRGIRQNPYMMNRMRQSEISWYIKTYTTRFGKLKYWTQFYYLPLLRKLFSKNTTTSSPGSSINSSSDYVYALHGSCLIFTPMFFTAFKGFDEDTFLFGEELILAEKVYQANMRCWFCADTKVFHEEDVSTDAYLRGSQGSRKTKFFLRNQYNSYRYLTCKYLMNPTSERNAIPS
jgi:GT2 family glycosyltransferase